MNPQLPPLPELDLLDLAGKAGFHVDEGWITCFGESSHYPIPEMPSLRKFAELVGLQCAEAERARILAGLERMSEQCHELKRAAAAKGDQSKAQCMRHRLMELALVRNLVNSK